MNVGRQLHLFRSKHQRGKEPTPAPEFHLHFAVADILHRWLDRKWKFNHIASGEYRLPATAARLKRMGVVAGWPDFILMAPTGKAHFIECKREHGGYLSEEQQLFAEWCVENRVPHAVVRSLAEAIKVLGEWGAIRTGIKLQ